MLDWPTQSITPFHSFITPPKSPVSGIEPCDFILQAVTRKTIIRRGSIDVGVDGGIDVEEDLEGSRER